MKLSQRLNALIRLGRHLRTGNDEYLEAVIHRTAVNNPWLTKANQKQAIQSIADHMLTAEALETWVKAYSIPEDHQERKLVGLVLAGNIPLVGFHDLISIFISGHRAQVKLSDKDPFLTPYLIRLLDDFQAGSAEYFQIDQQLKGYDAVIATGSNNSARYFEAYFKDKPHIIRRNRNGVAILNGTENEKDLKNLGKDVFQYFGLGCRNVSKIYVPKGYVFEPLLEAFHEYREIIRHTKYKNNFDYQYAVLLLNKESFLADGCIILQEHPAIPSKIAGLHYEFYEEKAQLEAQLNAHKQAIQCVVSKQRDFGNLTTIPFGHAQQPGLFDYADGVDTMAFLLGL